VPADEFGERLLLSAQEAAQQLAVVGRRVALGEGAENGLEGTQAHGHPTVGS
jgi:hypothetical protein